MKRIFYLLTLGLFSSGYLAAQVQHLKVESKPIRIVDQSASAVKIQPLVEAKGNSIWSSDFSDPSEWAYSNSSAPLPLDWEIITDVNASPVAGLNPLGFSGASNGFAFINGDAEGENSVQNANLTMVNPIDLSLFENVSLSFLQVTRNFATTYTVRVSIDGGVSWIPFPVNESLGSSVNTPNPEAYVLNISSVAAGQSNVLIQFNYTADWGWFWAIDDVAIISTPDNDLAITGRTFINNYFDFPGVGEDTEFVKRFEYWNQPQYITRPFNFSATVINNGAVAQTNVQLEVTFIAPDLSTQTFLSEVGLTVETGGIDTLQILDVVPDAWEFPAAVGTYTAEFRVIQNETDAFPENNLGISHTTRISNDNSDPAFFQNDRGVASNLPLPDDASDAIHGNRFVFTQPEIANKAITHIEFVLLNSGSSITVPGEIIFLNVRTGSVYDPEDDNNVVTRLFDTEEIQFIIEPGSITTAGAPIWNSVELPTPLLIEPDLIYQGEIEIPAGDGPIAFVALSNDNESLASVVINLGDGTPAWGSYTDIATMIRFRTQDAETSSTISYESGIKLTQNYPNPFIDYTTIQYQTDETSPVRLEVFDVTGKLVFQKNLGQSVALAANLYTFQRNDLPAGTYTYSIVSTNDRVTRKMTIE